MSFALVGMGMAGGGLLLRCFCLAPAPAAEAEADRTNRRSRSPDSTVAPGAAGGGSNNIPAGALADFSLKQRRWGLPGRGGGRAGWGRAHC